MNPTSSAHRVPWSNRNTERIVNLSKIPLWNRSVVGHQVRAIYPMTELGMRISLWRGDITELQVDAVVNAANDRLAGGGGVDGAIHRRAGKQDLIAACKPFKGCPAGWAEITTGFRLPAKYVIHCVGPRNGSEDLLESTYKQALKLCSENGIRTVAFPCIATGLYKFPNEHAAEVSIRTVLDYLEEHEEHLPREKSLCRTMDKVENRNAHFQSVCSQKESFQPDLTKVKAGQFVKNKTRREREPANVRTLVSERCIETETNRLLSWDKFIFDSNGDELPIYEDCDFILKTLSEEKDVKIACASRTRNGAVANLLLKLRDWTDLFDYIEIYPNPKSKHFNALSRKSGIDFCDMIFFEDSPWNVRDVLSLGVECHYVTNGISVDVIRNSLALYHKQRQKSNTPTPTRRGKY